MPADGPLVCRFVLCPLAHSHVATKSWRRGHTESLFQVLPPFLAGPCRCPHGPSRASLRLCLSLTPKAAPCHSSPFSPTGQTLGAGAPPLTQDGLHTPSEPSVVGPPGPSRAGLPGDSEDGAVAGWGLTSRWFLCRPSRHEPRAEPSPCSPGPPGRKAPIVPPQPPLRPLRRLEIPGLALGPMGSPLAGQGQEHS